MKSLNILKNSPLLAKQLVIPLQKEGLKVFLSCVSQQSFLVQLHVIQVFHYGLVCFLPDCVSARTNNMRTAREIVKIGIQLQNVVSSGPVI